MSLTLVQIFLDAVKTHRNPAMFMRKSGDTWEKIPAERALGDVQDLAIGLAGLGIRHGDRVGLLSENRYEWAVADLAILSLGAATVPIYPTLTAEQSAYMLRDAGTKVLFVSSAQQLAKLQPVLGGLPELTKIVVMDGGAGANVMSFGDLARAGADARRADAGGYERHTASVKPANLATIIYTSGTTGDPKGAMLTHSNIASNVVSALQVMEVRPTDSCVSFLPLCHIFERMGGMYCMIRAGASIAYAQSTDTVAQDAIDVRPTVLCGVPRFYEKVYARVMDARAGFPPIRAALFDWGLELGKQMAAHRFAGTQAGGWLALRAGIADRLVFAKIRARVGGRLRFCISGGAPLNAKVMEFFFAIGIPVYEGYGLTETSPVICLTPAARPKPGRVGPAVPGVELRIGDEGEILTRGPHVMKGYYNNPEATAQTITDGWFHTGDIGEIDADGYLKITDRLKELIVLAGGKKVAPQPIENRLKSNEWIAEAVLIGDRRAFITCLIVPDAAKLKAAGAEGEKAHALIQGAVDQVNADLARFEQIKKFTLLERELSQEAGELTATLKVKRRVVDQHYAAKIEAMYEGHQVPVVS